jgi:hypothetical protein
MTFDGAVIREQGVTFAIAVVRRGLLSNPAERDRSLAQFQFYFGGLPIVLMEQDTAGSPTWYGRPDLTRFLQNVPVGSIPWKRYSR